MPYPRNPELKNLSTKLLQLSHEIIASFNETAINSISKIWLETIIDAHRGVIRPGSDEHDNLLTTAIQRLIDTADIRENAKRWFGSFNK